MVLCAHTTGLLLSGDLWPTLSRYVGPSILPHVREYSVMAAPQSVLADRPGCGAALTQCPWARAQLCPPVGSPGHGAAFSHAIIEMEATDVPVSLKQSRGQARSGGTSLLGASLAFTGGTL